MTVILVLVMFIVFLAIDYFMKPATSTYVPRGTQYTTPGFEVLGALAQDGGTLKSEDAETEEVMAKMRRTNAAKAVK